MPKPDYDTTIARMAGNIAGALLRPDFDDPARIALKAVRLARAIVAAVKLTEPPIDTRPVRQPLPPPADV